MMNGNRAKTLLIDTLKGIIEQEQSTESGTHFWPALTEEELNTYTDTVSHSVQEAIIKITANTLVVQGVHLQSRSDDLIYYRDLKGGIPVIPVEALPDITSIKAASKLIMTQLGIHKNKCLAKNEVIENDYSNKRTHYISKLVKKNFSVSEGADFLEEQIAKQVVLLDRFIKSSNHYIFSIHNFDTFAFNADREFR